MATASSPQSTWRSMQASSAPTARAVPQLVCSGIDHFRASVNALPMWSPCSWVIRMASRLLTLKPRRARRRSTSFAENPQSSSTRVVVVPLCASTSSALPSLPLPRLANLTVRLVQLCMQQRHDTLRVRRRIHLAVRVEYRNLGQRVTLRAYIHEELLTRFLRAVTAIEQLAEETFPLQFLHRIRVANVINALLAVAIVDGEVGTVEREAHAQPCTVERLGQIQRRGAVSRVDLRRRRRGTCLCQELLCLSVGQAELLHQLRQKHRFERRVARTLLPTRGCLVLPRQHFFHRAVRDRDIGR